LGFEVTQDRTLTLTLTLTLTHSVCCFTIAKSDKTEKIYQKMGKRISGAKIIVIDEISLTSLEDFYRQHIAYSRVLSTLTECPIEKQKILHTPFGGLHVILLNTLSELAAAINNDASFSTTMTNLIATKVGLTSNNTFSGSNTFLNLPYYVNTSDQLINKNYVDGRFTTLLSANNSFTGSNTFNSSSGNIIDRLFSTILSINNGNSRRNVANYFECGMGATSPYIYIYYGNLDLLIRMIVV
jgi:hypothetical protein